MLSPAATSVPQLEEVPVVAGPLMWADGPDLASFCSARVRLELAESKSRAESAEAF